MINRKATQVGIWDEHLTRQAPFPFFLLDTVTQSVTFLETRYVKQ